MDRDGMRRDGVAGVSVAALLLPEAIAYGGIAGFPPGQALVAALAGIAAYALVGRSRVAIVAPTSASAATLAAATASLAIADPSQRLLAAVVMVGLVGLLFLIAGALRLGFVAAFGAPGGRLCQGNHAVQRIHLGGLSAPPDQANDGREEFRQGARQGIGLCAVA